MGKGCAPRKGHNVTKFANAYDNINWGVSETKDKPIEPEKIIVEDQVLFDEYFKPEELNEIADSLEFEFEQSDLPVDENGAVKGRLHIKLTFLSDD